MANGQFEKRLGDLSQVYEEEARETLGQLTDRLKEVLDAEECRTLARVLLHWREKAPSSVLSEEERAVRRKAAGDPEVRILWERVWQLGAVADRSRGHDGPWEEVQRWLTA